MSDQLLQAVGGLVTDHTFRDAVFKKFNKTMADFGITDQDAIDRLSKMVNGGQSVRNLLIQLEPYVCGGNLENCEPMRKFTKPPGPTPYVAQRATVKKKKAAKKKK
jgi:hypothetical protein